MNTDALNNLWQCADAMVAPKEHEADYFRCYGNSHRMVYPMCRAAELWESDGDWEILAGDQHSTVISNKYKTVFDILVDDQHPVVFATQKGPYRSTGVSREIDDDIPF